MADDCIFCRIARGDIRAQVVHSDEESVAFRDVNPQAPTHVLVVPRRHIESIAAMEDDDARLIGHLFAVAREVAREAGLDGGYRLVVNVGADAGQTVPHVHLHVIGGRPLDWPPG